MSIHVPVLQKEVIELFDPKPNQNFIDCTYGGGGHSRAILERTAPGGRLLAIDQDPEVAERASRQAGDKRVTFVTEDFKNLKAVYQEYFHLPVSGILLDLGFSSDQLESSGRGFSFQKEEPLDMRLAGENSQLTAEEIINHWPAERIEKVLRIYGEEPKSKEIARALIAYRKKKRIDSTTILNKIILSVLSPHARRVHPGIHPATKTYQALRVAVNGELEALAGALPQAVEILEPGGRLAVISFQGLEDRIVKRFFKTQDQQGLSIVNKKPLEPNREEVKANPRSRSAKMRVAEKI